MLIDDTALDALAELDGQMLVLVAVGGCLLGIGVTLLVLRQVAGLAGVLGGFLCLWPFERVIMQRSALFRGLPRVLLPPNVTPEGTPHVH